MEPNTLARKVTYKVELPGGQQRLREAALYVMTKCRDWDHFGLTKLNKVLWRADFRSYAERGSPITGRIYQRLPNGPAPVEMKPLLNELVLSGFVSLIETPIPGEQRPVTEVEPNLRDFSPHEIEYVDEAIEYFHYHTGTQASNESHGIAWKTRNDGDPIPYEASYFDDRPLPVGLRAKLVEMANSRKWQSN